MPISQDAVELDKIKNKKTNNTFDLYYTKQKTIYKHNWTELSFLLLYLFLFFNLLLSYATLPLAG